MPRTLLTPVAAPGSNMTAGTVLPFTAADVSSLNAVPATGKELLIVFNSTGGSLTFTLTSVADPYGRLGTITTETVAAGAYKIYGPLPLLGWQQTDGRLYFQASGAGILFAVLTVP